MTSHPVGVRGLLLVLQAGCRHSEDISYVPLKPQIYQGKRVDTVKAVNSNHTGTDVSHAWMYHNVL